MNKKEQAIFDELQKQARMNRALRWSDGDVGPDVPVPDRGHTTGWLYWAGTACRAERAWSECVSHGTGDYNPDSRRRSGSQRGRRLYSKRSLALRALRAEKEREFARILAGIDLQIEEAVTEETNAAMRVESDMTAEQTEEVMPMEWK